MAGRGGIGWDGPAAVVETHVSILVFLADRVYKLKKPVRFPFLDFSTPARRRDACEREVQLNRRLSPDVYCGVLDVAGPDGVVRDHLVEMVRMPPDRRLSTLVTSGAPGVERHLTALARVLATFHAEVGRGDSLGADAGYSAASASLEGELAELADLAAGPDAVLDPGLLDDVANRARRWLAGRGPLFVERAAAGFVVDGHGDLRADDVYCLDDGPRVLDCIEFSDRLRHVDVWDDVAFVLMDLRRLGRPDLAAHLAVAYRSFSGNDVVPALVHFFMARWALVRAKVEGLRARQLEPGADHDRAVVEAADLLALAGDDLAAAEVRLVLVGGLPGTGKSTVAEAVGGALGAVVLASDEVRKERAGIPFGTSSAGRYREGIYDPTTTRDTYQALLDRARVGLERATTVVLDASWTDQELRAFARRLGATAGARVSELRCACPAEVADDRLRARRAAGGGVSDADEAVAEAMGLDADPWPEAVVIDTDAPVDVVVGRALRALGVDQDADALGLTS
jgi:uncharacterized protein